MYRLVFVLVFSLCVYESFSQNCTVVGTSPLNWVNPGPVCNEGGNAGTKTILIIPANFTVVFDSNGDTWSGTRIDVYGTLLIDKDVTINSNITVYNGGSLKLQSKLSMGNAANCGFGLSIKQGGVVDVGGTGSDRLSICGKELMKGNGSCNSCGGTNSGTCAYNGNPYCEPSGGFSGPLGYDEQGYDVVLPIELAYLVANVSDEVVCLNWATSTEKNFDYFVVEKSTSGQKFDSLDFIPGNGNSKQLLKYSFIDQLPVIGKNYYRLKSVDFDRTFKHSPLVMVDFQGENNIVVYPNPTINNYIRVRTNFSPREGDRIEIYDNIGTKLMNVVAFNSENGMQLASSLKPGSYLLRYVSGEYYKVVRFNVQ